MDIVERLRGWLYPQNLKKLLEEAATEIERLRESLKVFANNVKETNVGIDENWAKTVNALKAENQRLREALQWAIKDCDAKTNHETIKRELLEALKEKE